MTNFIDKLMFDNHNQCVAAGWWDKDRSHFVLLQLIITELAEATEGVRKDIMDRHLPDIKNEDVELADALLRTVDIGYAFGWIYYPEVHPHYLVKPGLNVQNHLACVMCVSQLAHKILNFASEKTTIDHGFSKLINSILLTAKLAGYDIEKTCYLKMAVNARREDHKRENQPCI